jgi:hypothetical protein
MASRMGQRDGFSRGDLVKLNSMYQCDNVVPGSPSKPSGGGGNGFNQAVGGFISGLGAFFQGLGGGGRHDENDISSIEFDK